MNNNKNIFLCTKFYVYKTKMSIPNNTDTKNSIISKYEMFKIFKTNANNKPNNSTK